MMDEKLKANDFHSILFSKRPKNLDNLGHLIGLHSHNHVNYNRRV